MQSKKGVYYFFENVFVIPLWFLVIHGDFCDFHFSSLVILGDSWCFFGDFHFFTNGIFLFYRSIILWFDLFWFILKKRAFTKFLKWYCFLQKEGLFVEQALLLSNMQMSSVAGHTVTASADLERVITFVFVSRLWYRVRGLNRVIIEAFHVVLASWCLFQLSVIFRPYKSIQLWNRHCRYTRHGGFLSFHHGNLLRLF